MYVYIWSFCSFAPHYELQNALKKFPTIYRALSAKNPIMSDSFGFSTIMLHSIVFIVCLLYTWVNVCHMCAYM